MTRNAVPPFMNVQVPTIVCVALSMTLAIGPSLANDEPDQQNVVVNYEALDWLPENKGKVAAPKLKPLSVVRSGRKTSVYSQMVANNVAVPVALPVAFTAEDALNNALDVKSAEPHVSVVFKRPIINKTRPVAQNKRMDKVASIEPARPTVRARPPAASAKAPRFLHDGPPPIISWNEKSPIGAVRFASGGFDVMDIDRGSLPSLDALALRIAPSGKRILLKAFAGSSGDRSHNAHKQALKRGLAVRRYLIAKGVPATHIDVRAVGGATDGRGLDRVDVVAAAR